MRVIASLTIVTLLVAGVATLVSGPLYRRLNAGECAAAYAQAHTRADTARVDLHPYLSAAGATGDHRCGEVRAVATTNVVNIAPR